jgi:hypothetical protein
MKFRWFFALYTAMTPTLTALAQEGPSSRNDQAAVIRQMAGCFKVTFNYIEDGTHDAFYEPIYEKAEITKDVPLTIERTMFIQGQMQKHWSETWTAIDSNLWQQEVTGPFGDFRYSCQGVWTQNQWSCIAEHAPKPRRDRARPYETITRNNTLQINPQRWVHVQLNTKWTDQNELYSTESGWNIYEKVDSSLCVAP